MRVLLWTEGFLPHIGGVAVLSAHFLAEMQARGYEFAIVTSLHDPELPARDTYYGSCIYRFPFSQALVHRNLREIKLIRQAILDLKTEFQPEILQINECGPSNFFQLLTRTAIPELLAIHSVMPQQVSATNGLLAQSLRAADWIVAISQATLDDVCQIVPEIRPRTSLIYDGAPLPLLEPSPLPDEMFNAPIIFCAGRLVHEKGFDVMLEAFASVLKKHPRARLIIAGNGEERPRLLGRTADLGLSGAVDFPGWILPEEMHHAMNKATLVVMPSRWREPFGMIALEGMQMGRPVIASRTGGLTEVVADGETGILFENENPTALADAVNYLLEHRDAARRMGQAGRKRAQMRFSIGALGDAYEDLYRRLRVQNA